MRKWLTDHLAKGFRITSLAGDDFEKDHAQDAWSIVMTRGTSLGDQLFTGPAAWPAAWIAENTKKGFQITHCSGFGDQWVVVMTNSASPALQTLSDGGAWDDAWVKERWRQ